MVLSLLTAAPVLALLIAETIASPACSPDDPCRAALRSVTYWTDAPVVFVAYALVVLPFLFPRAAVWCALLLALAVVTGAGVASYPLGWAGAAVGWAILGGLDVAGRRRQRRLCAGWGPVERPDLPSRPLRWDEDTRRLGGLIALGLLLGSATLTVLHSAQLRDVERFEAASARVNGTVVTPGVDGPLVLVVNGRTYEIDLTIESYRTGETVPVLVDSRTGRVSLVAEPDDPSWMLGWAAVAVVLAACTWTTLWSRGRRRVDLLRNGGPAVELLLLDNDFTTLTDTALGERWREVIIGDLLPVEAAFVDADRDEPRPRRGFGQPAIADIDHEDQPRSPEQLSDADVRAWADNPGDDEDEEFGVDVPPRPVKVIGRLGDGYPVLVHDGTQLLLSSRAIRDPWLLRRFLPRRSAINAGGNQPSAQDGHPRRQGRRQSVMFLPLAFLLAVPAGLALWWQFNVPAVTLTWIDTIFLGGLALTLAAGLHRLAQTGRAVLHPHAAGLRLEGPFVTTVLPAHRVIDIVTAQQSIVLRLTAPSDLIDVDIDLINGKPTTADDATTLVHQWLREADSIHVGWLHRPSPSLGPPALLIAAIAVSAAFTI